MLYNPYHSVAITISLHRKDVAIAKQLTGKASCKRAAWHLQTHDGNRNDLKLERFELEPQKCCNICHHVAPFLCPFVLGLNTYPTKHDGYFPQKKVSVNSVLLDTNTVSPDPRIEHKSAGNPWMLKKCFFVWHMCFPVFSCVFLPGCSHPQSSFRTIMTPPQKMKKTHAKQTHAKQVQCCPTRKRKSNTYSPKHWRTCERTLSYSNMLYII